MKKIFLLTVLVVFGLFLAGCAGAPSEQNTIEETKQSGAVSKEGSDSAINGESGKINGSIQQGNGYISDSNKSVEEVASNPLDDLDEPNLDTTADEFPSPI